MAFTGIDGTMTEEIVNNITINKTEPNPDLISSNLTTYGSIETDFYMTAP